MNKRRDVLNWCASASLTLLLMVWLGGCVPSRDGGFVPPGPNTPVSTGSVDDAVRSYVLALAGTADYVAGEVEAGRADGGGAQNEKFTAAAGPQLQKFGGDLDRAVKAAVPTSSAATPDGKLPAYRVEKGRQWRAVGASLRKAVGR